MHHLPGQFILALTLGIFLYACRSTSNEILSPNIAEAEFILPVTSTDLPVEFSGTIAYQHILSQEAFGPRPVGSTAGQQTGEYIIKALETWGWQVETQSFIFKGVAGRNIIGRAGSGPIIILGAHYDTRPIAERDPVPAKHQEPTPGANDAGSGVAVLLEIARVLNVEATQREIWLTFFDAEDKGFIDGWPFLVGSRKLAEGLTRKPETVIVVDMVGDADQTIYFDYNSNRTLSEEIWAIATELGYGDMFIPEPKYFIFDDHFPFLEQGIPAIDIIDFDYPYWHTTADTADKISPDSLERVGRTLVAWLERPKGG
jgi:glutaminyl-peptide cyclotransferase